MLGLVAFKDQMHIAFVISNDYYSSYASPWLHLAVEKKLGSLAYQASNAFCQSVFGTSHQLRDEVTDADARYGDALLLLNDALARAASTQLPELLVPILLLLMHTSSNRSIEESEVHIEGMRQLLIICGPEAFQKDHLWAATTSCRAVLASYALDHKQASFLEHENWRSASWSPTNGLRSALDSINDIFVALPGLHQQSQELRGARQDMHASMHFLDRITHQIDRLCHWRNGWESEHSHLVWEEDRSHVITPGYEPAYPPQASRLLRFAESESAVAVSMYNAILLSISSLLSQMHPCVDVGSIATLGTACAMPGATAHTDVALVPGVKEGLLNPVSPARQICRAFDYQLLSADRITAPAVYWLFPFGCARHILAGDELWGDWAQEMLAASHAKRSHGSGIVSGGHGLYILERCESGLD
ncbi:hypothetical protein LTR53_008453 [Teratosphaeriaceae sp. CCFEE 6253]|nr:hypothetical protein LTR53_008453 [Teratosphaeriaceae sp. CCFEE 6253]